MLQRNDFSNEDIVATEELISNYLQLLDQKIREFKKKSENAYALSLGMIFSSFKKKL